jgi:hypothetical protein
MDPMNDRTHITSVDANRAMSNRPSKSDNMNSGANKARAGKSRVSKRLSLVSPPADSIVTRSSAYIAPESRDAMIAEAAYFHSAHRGFEPGHEVDDWLAAESEIDAALARGDLPRFMD